MPSTSFNIAMLQRAVSNFSRQQLLEAWNEVVQMVYAENMAQSLSLGVDGKPPLLVTTAGTLQYTLADTLAREIGNVLCEVPEDAPGYDVTRDRSGYASERTVTVAGRLYWVVPVVTVSATYGTRPTLTFVNDPGDTTDVYRVQYYKKHAPITTENINTAIPEELHIHLRQATLALLTTENYGDTGLQSQELEDIIVKVRRRMGRGAQARVGRTGVRMEENIARSGSGYGYRRSK